jgi:hypothetical protein
MLLRSNWIFEHGKDVFIAVKGPGSVGAAIKSYENDF